MRENGKLTGDEKKIKIKLEEKRENGKVWPRDEQKIGKDTNP